MKVQLGLKCLVWRAAAEQIGQACTLAIAGLILSYAGWHASFAVYLPCLCCSLLLLPFVFLTIAKHKIITLPKTILLEELTEVEEPIKKLVQ